MLPEYEQALAWLETAHHYAVTGSVAVAARHAATIRAMLARPLMPETPTREMRAAMERVPGASATIVYANLRDELMKPSPPPTKEVDVWHVEYVTDAGLPAIQLHTSRDAADLAAEMRSAREYRCVRVTGPHKHLVVA